MEVGMKRMRKVILISFGFIILFGEVPSFASNDGGDDDKAIRQTIDDNIGWFKTKDFDLLFRTIPDDSTFFIFHPDSKSTIRSREEFLKFAEFFQNPDLKYAGHEIRELNVQRSRSGEVAWFSAILEDCSEFKGRKGCWKDCRWTGVLEKREGRWVIVQMHFSFAEDVVRGEALKSAGNK